MERFQGKTFHTNNWDHSYDYRQKRVAIIGSGASAAQVIPAIAPDVEHLHVFQRTPHWVLPRADRAFGPFQRWLLGLKPAYKLLRWMIYWQFETRVIAFKYSKPADPHGPATRPALPQASGARPRITQKTDAGLHHRLQAGDCLQHPTTRRWAAAT